MLKKTIRRLGALAMVLAMAVSVFAVNASAAVTEEQPTYTPTKEVEFTKTITKKAEAYVPAGTYEFTLTPSTDKINNTEKSASQISGGAVLEANISSDYTKNAEPTVTVGTGKITVTASDYGQPGVYKYTLTEKAGAFKDGVSYAGSSKEFYVWIGRVEGQLVVLSAYFGNAEGTEKETNPTFTNPYNTNMLTVEKEVTGLQGDTSKDFSFTLKVNKADSNKQYQFKKGDKGTLTDLEFNANGEYTFTLKHSEKIYFYGLVANDKCTVTEASAAGYTTTYQLNTGNPAATLSEFAMDADKSVKVVNDKGATTPGGVIMTIAPYALMVVLAGAFAVVFLTRRNRAE